MFDGLLGSRVDGGYRRVLSSKQLQSARTETWDKDWSSEGTGVTASQGPTPTVWRVRTRSHNSTGTVEMVNHDPVAPVPNGNV